MLNCEPIEMSICRQRITSVIPTAATSTGALLTSEGAELLGPEEPRGAPTARTSRSSGVGRGDRELAAIAGRS